MRFVADARLDRFEVGVAFFTQPGVLDKAGKATQIASKLVSMLRVVLAREANAPIFTRSKQWAHSRLLEAEKCVSNTATTARMSPIKSKNKKKYID